MLEILQRPDFTLETCADEFQVTLPALCAFLTSDRGLVLLAHTELAQAIHIRAIAIAQLPRVIDAMTYALEDFANTCRNVPINPRSMPALEFVERAKDTARRNGQLLLRLAHFTPRPLRAYTQPTNSPSPMGARAGGRASSTSNPATPTQPTPAPQALTSPERERAGLPTSDIPHPKSEIAPLTLLPAQRGEDRLAIGQAGEGNKTHLSAHAVQYTTAAPTTHPTRPRVTTPPRAPPQTPTPQPNLCTST